MEEKNLKGIMVTLIVVALALAGVLAYIWIQKSRLVNDLNMEKQELTEQMVALQNDYEGLSSEYDTINAQLDSSKEEVAQLIERIKKTEATNRAKMRQYEKELGTLRTIMRNYIVQIDSLNTLNKKLTADAAAARQEAAESRQQNENLNKTVASLSSQVAAGAVIKSTGLRAAAYNASGAVTDRSSRVVKILTSITLVANELAKHGPVRVYVVIKDPDGNVLTNGVSRTLSYNGSTIQTSASREVDYQGEEVEMTIFMNDVPEYFKGMYTVEAYTEQTLLGTTELLLR